jgi:hypothetical protein
LHLSFTLRHFMGGFSLPAPLMQAAGIAGLAFDLVVRRAVEEDTEEETSSSDPVDMNDPELLAEVQRSIDDSAAQWWRHPVAFSDPHRLPESG